jgi:hypothetical protein
MAPYTSLCLPLSPPPAACRVAQTQDFYHPLPAGSRPQVLGLTASPEGMVQEPHRRNRVQLGLQRNLNSWLITVPGQGPLRWVS